MKIIYNPYLTGAAYISQSLWDTAIVGDAALLEQLLMRAGLPQTVADEDSPDNDTRIDPYIEALRSLGDSVFSESLKADEKGTAKMLLQWRDTLVMAGWTAEPFLQAQSDKLRVIAQCDHALKDYPSRADRWREVYLHLQAGKKILKDSDSVEVRIPKLLIPPLIADVLAALKPHVTYKMEELDASLQPDGNCCTVIAPHEQYEAWQLLAKLPYDAQTMLVCNDEKRLSDTMQAIGGEQWQTSRVGCPHPVATIFDQVDIPSRIVWLDCAGNGQRINPYAFLSVSEIKELKSQGISIPEAEAQSACQIQWLYTLLNHINEWILVTPKCHMGEAIGEHPVVTSLKLDEAYFNAVCAKGQCIQLPYTDEIEIKKLEPTGDIRLSKELLKRITPPSDSATTIEQLVNVPLDYVLEKLGGLSAPEDDQEPNENLMKGPIAHKVVELLINDPKSDGTYPLKQIKERFDKEYPGIFDKAMEDEKVAKEAAFLKQDDNKNMLAVFKEDLHQSIARLLEIIAEKQLAPIRCEYEFTTPFEPFEHPHGYVDMLLEDVNKNLVIIDLKWSTRDVYQKAIENKKGGEAYQLYMYKHAVEAQMAPKKVAWYAYYVFPQMELYTEPATVTPKWEDWLAERAERLTQLNEGLIVQADPKKDEYPNHILLKNLNLK